MANVLDIVTRDNTTFTIFENDQVLTADQLNDLFNYLDVQSRITRSKSIGVGIICGLEIGQLNNKQMVVSRGAAITTDGDLLYFNTDQVFDQYQLFEDTNAKYSYFRNGNQVVPIYELLSSAAANPAGLAIGGFETASNTVINDYVGVLYLEDYDNDPNVCTGLDCDNKGQVAVKNLKVLLIHKSDMNQLLQSIPAVNSNYFELDDMVVPRIPLKSSIATYAALTDALNTVVGGSFKDEIKAKLGEAYQICMDMVSDQFNGTDPTADWNTLLDGYFGNVNSLYLQYYYDFERDISYAYNELRETLFTGNMIASPDVQLFPKHILMGLVSDAALSAPQVPPASPPTGGNVFGNLPIMQRLRFDISLLIRRFHAIHVDLDYRHPFYESPVLNNGSENIERTRFCFMRLHSMIHNFKIPTTTDLQNAASGIKITPDRFEDNRLGERSLPFYYNINKDIPANLYWSYDANVRIKENEILSYWAGQYADAKPAVLSPLQYNLFPYNYFRIEGHIGFTHMDVENSLNQIIADNNLPINIVTVQIENIPETIPTRPWYFPHLQVYENFVRDTFADHMNQVELLHASLQTQIAAQPDVVPADTVQKITVGAQSFSTSRTNVLKYNPLANEILNREPNTGRETYNSNFLVNYKADVKTVIDAATDVKALTKEFAFSNAATPHDFVINTDILHKVDNLSDLLIQNILIKKQGLVLGNFLNLNPGLEHAGGVTRGGTFVLVYTSADNLVVADFMLPYASVDKDIVADPPVFKPLEVIPKLNLAKVLEVVPHYVDEIDQRIIPLAKTADVDTLVNTKVASSFVDLNNNLDVRLSSQSQIVDSKLAIRDTQIETISRNNSTLFDRVLTAKIPSATMSASAAERIPSIERAPDSTIPDTTPTDSTPAQPGPILQRLPQTDTPGPVLSRTRMPLPGLMLGGKDFTKEVQALQTQRKELEKLKIKAPGRHAKESKILTAAKTLTDRLKAPKILKDPRNALVVKSLLSDIHAIRALIKTETLQSKADAIAKSANAINAKFLI